MNNNFMRQGSGNRNGNNNRNRNNRNNNMNRHRTGGGGGPNNKSFDSNGPDVKVRGTAQTIAEKYMQLGRDAQSSGDSVAAETYYQHAEHYYRVWAANQPVGASLIMSRKLGEEDEDEGADDLSDDEGVEPIAAEATGAENGVAEGAEGQDAPQAEGQQDGGNQQRRFNNNRNEQRDGNRDGNRERPRSRWQQRSRDRYPQQDGEAPMNGQAADGAVAPAVVDVMPSEARQPEPHVVETRQPETRQVEAQWEAPSFLQRAVPVPVVAVEADAEVAPVRRPRTRRPRVEDQAVISEVGHEPPATAE